MSTGEIAQFRKQQSMQEEAALLGLRGLASVSRHEFIEARMQQGAAYILQLLEDGKDEEAQRLMETRAWGQEELEGIEEGERGKCHTTTPS